MASFLDVCRFTAASSGTGSFVVSSAVTGYQTPASANAVNGATYRYRAESADLSQWEVGFGVYTVSTTTLTRATVLFNSSGGTSAISFTSAPQVAVVALAEDLTLTQPAAKLDQQAGTSAVLVVTPAHQQDHDGSAKAWVSFTGSTGATLAAYNASVSRTSAGLYVVTFATPFVSVNYVAHTTVMSATAIITSQLNAAKTTNTITVLCLVGSSATDPTTVDVVCFGRQ